MSADNAALYTGGAAVSAAVLRGLAAARDRPNPENDAACSPQKYARMGRNFRAGAWRHLDEDDLRQASNKAWGLVAETVKAISAQHGGIIHAHRSIAMVVDELAKLAGGGGDVELQRWIRNSFSVARMLHANFYEESVATDDVIAGLMLCEELSGRLYALFWLEGGRRPVTDRVALSRSPVRLDSGASRNDGWGYGKGI